MNDRPGEGDLLIARSHWSQTGAKSTSHNYRIVCDLNMKILQIFKFEPCNLRTLTD